MNTTTDTTEFRVFGGGLPTKEDVDALITMMDSRSEGDIIKHTEIETAIRTGRHTNRGISIITAWKKRAMRERNVLLVAVPGNGYRIANPSERVSYSSGMVKQGVRRIRRAGAVAETTRLEGLSDQEKRLRDHLRGLNARLRLAEITAPKTFEEL